MSSLTTDHCSLPTSLSAIVAVSRNNIIGREGGMPWRQSGDLKRFKQLTMGHHMIMGRKTFDSVGRPLPGRTSIVLSRQATLDLPAGVLHAHDLDEALRLCSDDPEPFVIGGGEIYRLAMPRVTRLYLTRINAELSGDTRIDFDFSHWRLVGEEKHTADAKNEYAYVFQVWERKP
jgi:dihydrofolate reductase